MSRCSSASMWSLNPSHPPHDKMIAESQRYLHRSGSTVDVSSPRRRPVLGTLPSRPSDSHWSSRDAANKLARIRWFTERAEVLVGTVWALLRLPQHWRPPEWQHAGGYRW